MFLRKKLLSQESRLKGFFITLALLVGLQPMTAVALDLSKEQQQQVFQYVQHVMRQSSGEQSGNTFAAAAVGILPCIQGKESILGANEA